MTNFDVGSGSLLRRVLFLAGLALVGACSSGPPLGYYSAGSYGASPGYGAVGAYPTTPSYGAAGGYGSAVGYGGVGGSNSARSYNSFDTYGTAGSSYRSSGRCQYPWQYDAAGRRCGRRAASVRPGGY